MHILIKKAQKGNPDAFVQLMNQYEKVMYKVAKGYLRNEEDVADAISETILSAFEHINELKYPEYFKTWLTKILINKCNNILYDKKRCQAVSALPELPQTDSQQSNLEFLDLLKNLNEDSRMIFLLYYGEGFNTREISQILEINENTIRSRLLRGRDKLRKEIY